MLKIYVNHNKQDIVHSYSIGQTFPQINGKLLKIEINGNELNRLAQHKDIPLVSLDSSYLVWHGRNAGSLLKILREVFDV
jgi:hypothetical protein